MIEKRGYSCTACFKKWDGAKVWSEQTCIDRTNVTRYLLKQFVSLTIMNNIVVSLLCWFDLVIQNHFTFFISWGEYLMFYFDSLCHWFPTKTFLSFSPSTKYHICVKFGICLHSQENRQLRNRMFFRDYITICRSIRKLRMMVKSISATINGEFQFSPQLVYCEWLSVLGLGKWQR